MTTTTAPKAPLARRRRYRRGLSRDEARRELQAAQADYEKAMRAANTAIHRRAKAADDAHNLAALSWAQIGADLGGMNHSSAVALAGRYRKAIAAGTTVKLGGKL